MDWLLAVWAWIPGPWWIKLIAISSAFDIIIGVLPEKIAKYPGALHKMLKEIYRAGMKLVETINAKRIPK